MGRELPAMTESSRIERVTGTAVVVRGNDIDTDRILPARFLRAITFEGLERHLFEDERGEARARGVTHPFDDPARREIPAHPTLALEALAGVLGPARRDPAPWFADLTGVTPLPGDASRQTPFHPGVVAERLARALGTRPRLIANGWLSRWARRALDLQPGDVLGRSGGEGLGYGIGASIGAAL